MAQVVLDRQHEQTTEPVRRTAAIAPAVHGRGAAVAAMAVGLVVVTAALLILVTARSTDPPTKVQPAPVGATVTDEVAPTISVSENRYEPGHTSSWHVHPGMHSVVVLSGTLTVYDDDCVRHQYGVGQSYLGGRQPHLARNEGSETVELVVTYVGTPSAPDHGSSVAAPRGCPAL